jgi:hypothetical protein
MHLGLSLDRLHCTARCGQGLSVLRGPQRGNFCLSPFLFIDSVACRQQIEEEFLLVVYLSCLLFVVCFVRGVRNVGSLLTASA